MRANINYSSTGRSRPKRLDLQYGAGLVDAYRAILSLVPVAAETMGRATPAAGRQCIEIIRFPGLEGGPEALAGGALKFEGEITHIR
jgi:hypothetical protein